MRELAEGISLAEWIEQGGRADEATVKAMAIQLLNVLDYLHRLTPPVIHRDIKPENVIRREDGQLYLVDFGSVQDIYRYTMSKSGTFVGTVGYMPLEQFRGEVFPSSDLYALGATLVYVLTGRSPDALPQKRMKLDIRPYLTTSPAFTRWLERLLKPASESFDGMTDSLVYLLLQQLLQVRSLTFSAHSRSATGWSGQGAGTVSVTLPRDACVVWQERGTWQNQQGTIMPFHNRYRWTGVGDRRLRLEHLRFQTPVHLIDLVPCCNDPKPQTWQAEQPHACGDDAYHLSLQRHDIALQMDWTITGPHKQEHIVYWYRDRPSASGGLSLANQRD